MTRMRQTIANRLKVAQNTAACLTTFNEIDMTNIMELRSRHKDEFLEKHGAKLGFMSAFVKASTAALQKNPDFAPLLDTKIKKGLEYGNTPLARAHMNVNVAYQEFAGEKVGFGTANGAPLQATDKHKASDPKDTAPPKAPSAG